MLGRCTHGIVGDAGRDCAVEPSGIGEERVQAPVAALNWRYVSIDV